MKRDPKTGAPDFYAFARDYLHTYLPTVRTSEDHRHMSAWLTVFGLVRTVSGSRKPDFV